MISLSTSGPMNFFILFSPLICGGWGEGEELGGHVATMNPPQERVFLIHLSALTEEYTVTGRNVANPINFLSNNLSEHKIFHFSN